MSEDFQKSYRAIRNAYEEKYGAGSWSKIKVSSESKESKAKAEKLPFGSEQKLSPAERERYTNAKKRLAGSLGMPTEGWGLYGRTIVGALKKKKEKKVDKSLSGITTLADFAKAEGEEKEMSESEEAEKEAEQEAKEEAKDPAEEEMKKEGVDMSGDDEDEEKSMTSAVDDLEEFAKAGPHKYKSRKKVKGKWVYDYGEAKKKAGKKAVESGGAAATVKKLNDQFQKKGTGAVASIDWEDGNNAKIRVEEATSGAFLGDVIIDSGGVKIPRKTLDRHGHGAATLKSHPDYPKPVESKFITTMQEAIGTFDIKPPKGATGSFTDKIVVEETRDENNERDFTLWAGSGMSVPLDVPQGATKGDIARVAQKKMDKLNEDTGGSAMVGTIDFVEPKATKESARSVATGAITLSKVRLLDERGFTVKHAADVAPTDTEDPDRGVGPLSLQQANALRDKGLVVVKKSMEGTMSGIENLEEFAKGGPYIGPKGGKYADPQHKIPWKEGKGGGTRLKSALPIVTQLAVLKQDPGEMSMGDKGDLRSVGFLKTNKSGNSVLTKQGKHAKGMSPEAYAGARRAVASVQRNEADISALPSSITSDLRSMGWVKTSKSGNSILTKQGKNSLNIIGAPPKMNKSLSGIEDLEQFAKGGPYIGPRGGKWADPDHKIPWADHEKAQAKGKKAKGITKHTDEDVDSTSVTELDLYADNDYELYKQKKNFHANVVRKMASGKYDHAQAPKLWNYFADRVADKYMKEFGAKGDKFPKKTRQALAHKMANDFHDEVKADPSEHEEHVPKKYKKDWGKKKEAKKSMSDVENLEEFAKAGLGVSVGGVAGGSGGSGGLPTGEPSMGGAGKEQGGKVAGVGKTSGNADSSAGEPIGAKDPKKQKLSEDDEDEKKALKPHKKPLEKKARKSMDTSPQGQRDQVAQEQAAAVSKLRKGEEDVTISAGVPSPEPEAEPIQKSSEWNQGEDSRVTYTDQADQEAAAFAKSDKFYSGGAPTLNTTPHLTKSQVCPACKTSMLKSLTACPTCGAGAVHPRVDLVLETGVDLAKSQKPGLRPAKATKDVYIPE